MKELLDNNLIYIIISIVLAYIGIKITNVS